MGVGSILLILTNCSLNLETTPTNDKGNRQTTSQAATGDDCEEDKDGEASLSLRAALSQCDDLATVTCLAHQFSPDVASGSRAGLECVAGGQVCFQVISYQHDTGAMMGQEDPDLFEPGGAYNRMEYSCAMTVGGKKAQGHGEDLNSALVALSTDCHSLAGEAL